MRRLDPAEIRQQIDNLRLQYPDLFEDEESKILAIESETEAVEYLSELVRQIEDAKALAEGTKLRIDELNARKDRFERQQDALRYLALQILQTIGERKIVLPCATVSLRDIPPKPVITSEALLPDIACKFVRKPDMAVLKEILENSGECPGAHLSNGGVGLTVRVK